jgi:Uma2 family endonuclease
VTVTSDVSTYEGLLDFLEHYEAPPGFKSELVRGEIVLSPQGEEHSEIILRGQLAAIAAGLPPWRANSDVLTPFPHTESGFCPDVGILRRSAVRGVRPRPRADIAAVIEVVSGDRGQKDYGIKVQEYAVAGIDAYLIADPYRGLCTLFSGPVEGKYPEPTSYRFGETVTFTADGTEFVLDTADWPRIG